MPALSFSLLCLDSGVNRKKQRHWLCLKRRLLAAQLIFKSQPLPSPAWAPGRAVGLGDTGRQGGRAGGRGEAQPASDQRMNTMHYSGRAGWRASVSKGQAVCRGLWTPQDLANLRARPHATPPLVSCLPIPGDPLGTSQETQGSELGRRLIKPPPHSGKPFLKPCIGSHESAELQETRRRRQSG